MFPLHFSKQFLLQNFVRHRWRSCVCNSNVNFKYVFYVTFIDTITLYGILTVPPQTLCGNHKKKQNCSPKGGLEKSIKIAYDLF